jgi:hypothetical protein
VLLRLFRQRQLQPGGCGLVSGADPLAVVASGELLVLFALEGQEATVKVYGVAVAMPQGQSRVPHLSTGQQ